MRKLSAVLCAGIFVLAGCGGGSDSTAATESTPERWDPCSITPEDLEATGLDPTYREVGWGDGIEVDDWALCTFKPPGKNLAYYLSVKSSLDRTIQEARSNSSNVNGHDVLVGEHDAYIYETHVGKTGRSCSIAVDLPPGVVVFSVIDMDELGRDRLCNRVLQHADHLQHALPPSVE